MTAGRGAPSVSRAWDTKVIEPVENFKYLGSGFSLDSLQQNKKSVDLKAATKIRLFKAIVESVLLYGSEKWTVTVWKVSIDATLECCEQPECALATT